MIINIILICVWTLYMLCEGGRESIFFHFSTFTTKPLKTNYHSLFLIQRTLVFGAFVLCIWLNTQSWILLLLIGFGLIPVNHINATQSGLQEDAVKCIYIDYAGDMWLALNKGISHVQINTPLTHWNKINGIRGTIESVARLQGSFYIATDKGVDKLNSATNLFNPTSITEPSWDLVPHNNILLAATKTAVYEISEKIEQKIFDAPGGVF